MQVALTSRQSALLLLAAKLRVMEDVPGHEFHGNQWSAGTVLGKDGQPLTLYHGSTAKGMTPATLNPDAQRVRAVTTPRGVAFTSDERTAHGTPGGGKFGSVVKANLVMHNPLDITKDVKAGQKKGMTFGDAKRAALGKLTSAHDGMIFRGDHYNHDEYVAFEKHQIREPHALRTSTRHHESAIHKAADTHLNAMTVAVMYGFMKGRKAYKSGGTKAAVKAIRASLLVSLPPVLLKCVEAGGKVAYAKVHRASALRTLRPQVPGQPHDTSGDFGLAFNVTDPNAVQWARDHAAELADGLSATSEQDIQDAVASALAGDGLDAAYDDILAAVGDEARANMIARTEIMDAANEGLAQGWDQAQEAGLLGSDAKKVWIATSGCCDECDEVDGEEVPLDEDFSVGDDPPLHPNCRCTMGIA